MVKVLTALVTSSRGPLPYFQYDARTSRRQTTRVEVVFQGERNPPAGLQFGSATGSVQAGDAGAMGMAGPMGDMGEVGVTCAAGITGVTAGTSSSTE
jgi:hypothetical protein